MRNIVEFQTRLIGLLNHNGKSRERSLFVLEMLSRCFHVAALMLQVALEKAGFLPPLDLSGFLVFFISAMVINHGFYLAKARSVHRLCPCSRVIRIYPAVLVMSLFLVATVPVGLIRPTLVAAIPYCVAMLVFLFKFTDEEEVRWRVDKTGRVWQWR